MSCTPKIYSYFIYGIKWYFTVKRIPVTLNRQALYEDKTLATFVENALQMVPISNQAFMAAWKITIIMLGRLPFSLPQRSLALSLALYLYSDLYHKLFSI